MPGGRGPEDTCQLRCQQYEDKINRLEAEHDAEIDEIQEQIKNLKKKRALSRRPMILRSAEDYIMKDALFRFLSGNTEEATFAVKNRPNKKPWVSWIKDNTYNAFIYCLRYPRFRAVVMESWGEPGVKAVDLVTDSVHRAKLSSEVHLSFEKEEVARSFSRVLEALPEDEELHVVQQVLQELRRSLLPETQKDDAAGTSVEEAGSLMQIPDEEGKESVPTNARKRSHADIAMAKEDKQETDEPAKKARIEDRGTKTEDPLSVKKTNKRKETDEVRAESRNLDRHRGDRHTRDRRSKERERTRHSKKRERTKDRGRDTGRRRSQKDEMPKKTSKDK